MKNNLNEKISVKIILSYIFILLLAPAAIVLGVTAFSDRAYLFVSAALAVLACAAFFLSFEHRGGNVYYVVVLAVMTALSVLGRCAFAYIPAFKPVAAMVIICGIYMGAQAGFLCGALSALISNFVFMQGPWTPFQMFAWGIIGLLSSFAAPLLKKNKLFLSLGGVTAGIFYSLFMDLWTVLWAENTFNLSRYIAAVITAVPTTAMYSVSNVIFLLLLAMPFGKKLDRIRTKYGIGENHNE